MMRIGHGYDAHAFTPGRPLRLGGITIPHERGLAGHSDGDAVIHALCDALLGAAGLPDIGHHFPDTKAEHADADSRNFLTHTMTLLRERNLHLLNADITILAQEPKLAPHLEAMRTELARTMQLPPEHINIKATTTDGLGAIGQRQGIAAHAVALLQNR